ncbi:BBE domain-containing protein, partial [Rhizobium ruizarguesonis]
ADDDRCIAWGRITGKSLSKLSMAGNYVNEQADAGTVVALYAYGPKKYQRLASLKTRFDTHNMFRLNKNIAPLA